MLRTALRAAERQSAIAVGEPEPTRCGRLRIGIACLREAGDVGHERPNIAVEQTAGSHSLARGCSLRAFAARQRKRNDRGLQRWLERKESRQAARSSKRGFMSLELLPSADRSRRRSPSECGARIPSHGTAMLAARTAARPSARRRPRCGTGILRQAPNSRTAHPHLRRHV